MKLLSAIALLILSSLFSLDDPPITEILPVQKSPSEINWLTWDEAVQLSEKGKKKIFLDVYTEWCRWCERMDTTTFKDPGVVEYINANFYPVRFDAEYKEDIRYKDEVFKFVKNGKRGYHQLAEKWLKGRLSYPTLVFMDENQDVIQSIVGFKNTEKFRLIATYFGSNEYRVTPWSTYCRNYEDEKQAVENFPSKN
ncbi:MAG: hypothetical protein DHS20C18_16880 [Saprospiraceae bacterium]|nr:MAG: hypothetical protein DHS20C18_16880 [Saprospiraceae bacterium]